MTSDPLTQEHRLLAVGLRWAEEPPVSQVPLQHDGEPRLVEGLHDNGAHGLVVCEEVERGEEEEEAQGQAATGGRRHGRERRGGETGQWSGKDGRKLDFD